MTQPTDIHTEANKILALISHKLKTPLSIINGYSEAVLSQASKERFSPFTEKALEEIHKQGSKMSSLVDKLLLFNKVSAMNPEELTLTDVKLKDLVKNCASQTLTQNQDESAAPAQTGVRSGVYIDIDCPESLHVRADANLLKHAVEELLTNAIKFNTKLEKIIKVQCANHGDNISVSVRDYGTGIRPQDVNRIFDPFYQMDDHFTGQINGWGLGLPLVKRVVELHGGAISVVSDRGLGTIFTITFPA